MARKLNRGCRLVLASHNPGKLAELTDLLRPHGITAISARSLGLSEPEEDAPDFVGNARIKALAAARASSLPALADDSGFCVAALNGAPGVHSARWAGSAKDFSHVMQRVNREAAEARDRRAWFVAALCLAWPDGHTETFVGRVDGQATWPPRGIKGFGYDPMFVPGGAVTTFGEMDGAEKHAFSHRARAFAQLMRGCLLADAEPGEQRVEDVLHADAAGDPAERP
jgi:XTP/dITP diphosphohydrolase